MSCVGGDVVNILCVGLLIWMLVLCNDGVVFG